MKHWITLTILLLLSMTNVRADARPQTSGSFIATAYAQRGITRSGRYTAPGVVAADLNFLPMGTKILVKNAGPYSGTYTVADTGGKVRGRHIDIFMPDVRKAIRFGKKMVEVTVLRWGDNLTVTGVRISPKAS